MHSTTNKYKKLFLGLMVSSAAAFSAFTAPALAQMPDNYPSRPITVINPQGVGGVSDIFMRVLAETMSRELGQQVIVDNRPGGSSNIGLRACADAAPDGYTFCILPGTAMTYNPFLMKDVPYDPVNDFKPVTNLFYATQILSVSAELGVKTVDELVEYSKTTPLTYTTAAPSFYIFFDQYSADRGGDIERVPFRSGGEATNDILSGTTPIALMAVGNVRSHMEAGTIKGLFIDSEERSPFFPDLPTIKEAGITDEIARGYFGFWAPAGTPDEIVTKMNELINSIGSDAEFVQQNLWERGLEPAFNTPEEFAAYYANGLTRAEAEVAAAGIEPQ